MTRDFIVNCDSLLGRLLFVQFHRPESLKTESGIQHPKTNMGRSVVNDELNASIVPGENLFPSCHVTDTVAIHTTEIVDRVRSGIGANTRKNAGHVMEASSSPSMALKLICKALMTTGEAVGTSIDTNDLLKKATTNDNTIVARNAHRARFGVGVSIEFT